MKTILFIEDEAALQKSLGDILRHNGYTVIGALDGEIGLKIAKLKNPDLILLDLILPKRDGFEVFQELKQDPQTNKIPVIVLTNLERMENVSKIMELGAKAYLVKANYDLQEVVEKVKKVIGD